MALIGRLEYGAPTLEKTFESKFNITGHATAKAQLEISNVNPADTAQYFCAASQHGVSTPLPALQKAGGLQHQSHTCMIDKGGVTVLKSAFTQSFCLCSDSDVISSTEIYLQCWLC